ncbi:MAG: murein biosynthesis integral membrane protein MurJ [Acidimicrobiia bacterium]|nr:murein biosynthesis integral membrane protein MurJ [Acidimicrobiia bacterium]
MTGRLTRPLQGLEANRAAIGMGAAAVVVAASVVLSRLLGLVRGSIIAYFLGISAEVDLFNAAFLIPDFLNYFLAGGYLTITFIPILTRYLTRNDEHGGMEAFTAIFRLLVIGVIVLSTIMWLLVPLLVPAIFSDISAADHRTLVGYTRLVIPAQIFFISGSLLTAFQYAHRRFLIPALAPLLYNVGIILGGLIGNAVGVRGAEGFLIGAVVGAVVGTFGLQWVGARRCGLFLTRGTAWITSPVRQYFAMAVPLMLGQSIAVLDESFTTFFGQFDEGAIGALHYARRTAMVPVGMIAQAAGVAAYPFLSNLAERKKHEELTITTVEAIRNTVFVSGLAVAGVFVVARPLIRLIYEWGGAFTASNGDLVTDLLFLFVFALPAWSIHQVVARNFYARRMMWVPVVVGTVNTVIAVGIWWRLRDALGIYGLALASTVSMTLYALSLTLVWLALTNFRAGWPILTALVRTILTGPIALAAGFGVILFMTGLGEGLRESSTGSIPFGFSVLMVLVAGSVTVAVYLVANWVTRSPELRTLGPHIWKRIRRRPGPTRNRGAHRGTDQMGSSPIQPGPRRVESEDAQAGTEPPAPPP